MKVNLKSLENIVAVDSNTVTASPAGKTDKVQVKRYMSGWTIKMQISVNGIIWHDDTAMEADKKMFSELLELGMSNRDIQFEVERQKARHIAADIFSIHKN